VVSARREYGAASAQATAIESRVKEQRHLRKQLDIASQQALRFAEAERQTQAWRKVLADVATALPADVWVTAIASQSDGSAVRLTLTCEGTSLDLATQFVMALKRSGTFTSAKLSATRNDAIGRERKVRFECVITVSDRVLGAPASSAPTAPSEEQAGAG
jgi:Tfp pilus assembly protein PilN